MCLCVSKTTLRLLGSGDAAKDWWMALSRWIDCPSPFRIYLFICPLPSWPTRLGVGGGVDLWMCCIELCLELKPLATATKKWNRKQNPKYQVELPVQMSFRGRFRDTQARHWPHFPSDRPRSQDRWCAWKMSFPLPPSLPVAVLLPFGTWLSPRCSASFLYALDIPLISFRSGAWQSCPTCGQGELSSFQSPFSLILTTEGWLGGPHVMAKERVVHRS